MTTTINNNGNITTVSQYGLKDSLTFDSSRTYISGEEITYHDLKKKNRIWGQILSGFQIHDMAKRGMKAYLKALSFCERKYD